MLNDILSQVNKPGRYIGGEWNIPPKDFKKADIKFALCFPDLYEVGMSNLGLRIIYGILNSMEGVSCERVFAPDRDMEYLLRSGNLGIFSLESRFNLKEFDIIGFSLGYELGYTNVLNILELGSIPLESSSRGAGFPLVIAGGPCALNPEPMHEFFDLFVIGEGEDALPDIIKVYREYKDAFRGAKISRQELLLKLADVEGVYVPEFYKVEYNPDGKIKEFALQIGNAPVKIRKRAVRNLDNAYFPADWLVPYIQIVHDRISLEVVRGCPNQCRFCQARAQYFPYRQREVATLINLACDAYRRTGYEEISLGGLSLSDYPGLEELLKSLIELFKEKGISISLPSLKPRFALRGASSLIAQIKKTGLTFAPEAATEKLRMVLGKSFVEQDFFQVLEQAFMSGYQHVKLYFMHGLPGEDLGDLGAIADFASSVSELRRKVAGRPAQVNVSVNTLIPKPHTPFQWLRMDSLDDMAYKQDYLLKKIKNKRLKLSLHNRHMSFLEGVLSRGDRRLSKVISRVFKKGARFDAWDEHFNFERWQEAFRECGINPDSYLEERAMDERLPWDFIDTGITKDALIKDCQNMKLEL